MHPRPEAVSGSCRRVEVVATLGEEGKTSQSLRGRTLLTALNPVQREAVLQTVGPVLIVAERARGRPGSSPTGSPT